MGVGGNVNISGNFQTNHLYTIGNLDVENSISIRTNGQLYVNGTDKTQIDGNILINSVNDSHITGNFICVGPEFNQANPLLYPGQFVTITITRSYLNSIDTNSFWLYSTNGKLGLGLGL